MTSVRLSRSHLNSRQHISSQIGEDTVLYPKLDRLHRETNGGDFSQLGIQETGKALATLASRIYAGWLPRAVMHVSSTDKEVRSSLGS